MGVQGKRVQRKLEGQFEEPDLIVDVESILRMAAEEDCLDGNGNLKLDKIAEKKNINVVYEDDMPSTQSGYFRAKNGVYTIGINNKHHRNRQRFTFAHELGHFYLHKGKDNQDADFEDEVYYRIENTSSIEYAANEFAARLLIPEDRLAQKVKDGMTDLNELADFFEVSLEAMKYRVLSLNYSIMSNG